MKKKIFIFYLLLINSCIVIFASEINAKILYCEGYIEIHRDNDIVDKSNIVPGFIIKEADLVKTGQDGYIELEIECCLSNLIYLKVNRNTAFYFTENQTRTDNEVLLRVLSGDVAVKSDNLLPNEKINVSSKNAVIAVKGTEFTVTTAPGGSLFVTCSKGSLLCRLISGTYYIIEPGIVLEITQNREVKKLKVDIDNFSKYRNEWFAECIGIFKTAAFSITKPLINQYEEYADRFNLVYDELVKYDKIFEKYKNGTAQFDETAVFEDKIEINSAIFNMRSIFFIYEELFYSIAEIKIFHNLSPIKGTLRKKYDIADFMNNFEKNYNSMIKKAAHTREIFTIYSQMDAGNLSTSIMEEVFSPNPLFN